jgi:glycerol-3-phosphate acyltransferase PlsY
LGKSWGYAVFAADAFKGFAAVRLAYFLAQRIPQAREYSGYFAILAAILCIVGHTFPVWLRFKGGKGVATSAGAIFGLMPLAAITIFVVWVVVFEITRYVSVASIVAALSLPAVVALLLRWQLVKGAELFYFSAVIATLVVWRHRSNFSRLLDGTEQRFSRK